MTRFLAHILPLLVLGSAHAADIHDAPIPETVNWVGIIIFLVIMVGGTVGFFWRIMQKDKKTKQDDQKLKA